MIFEKSSTRTRVSLRHGHAPARRQRARARRRRRRSSAAARPIADTARVLSRMVDAIMIRTDDHAKIEEMARHATVPVINGLTDRSHPCQIVADLLTVIEHGQGPAGLELAWLGDGNNVLHSIIEAAGLMKFDVRVGTPRGLRAGRGASSRGARAQRRDRSPSPTIAAEAVAGADVVVTDTWVSMGQAHAARKLAAMAPFQVNEALMARAQAERRSSIACPRISARKSARACSKGRSRWSSTRRRTASTRKSRSCCGVSASSDRSPSNGSGRPHMAGDDKEIDSGSRDRFRSPAQFTLARPERSRPHRSARPGAGGHPRRAPLSPRAEAPAREALVLTALMGGLLKGEGSQLTLQAQADGGIVEPAGVRFSRRGACVATCSTTPSGSTRWDPSRAGRSCSAQVPGDHLRLGGDRSALSGRRAARRCIR